MAPRPDPWGDLTTRSGGERLLVRPSPSPEENLQGFIHRLADANFIPMKRLWERVGGGLGRAPDAGALFLAELSGCTRAQAERFVGPRRPASSWALLPGVDVSQAHATAYPGICPACVEARGIIRSCWCVRLYVGCDDHRFRLLRCCARCGRRLASVRPSMSTCVCGAYLPAQQTHPVTNDEAALLALLRRTCEGSRPVAEEPKEPGDLSLDDLLGLVTLVGARRAALGGSRLLARDEETAGAILARAAAVLKDWPRNALEFIRPILLGDPENLEPGMRYAGLRMLKVLNRPSSELLSKQARGMMLGLALTAIEGRGIARLNPKSVDLGNGAVVGYVNTAEIGRMAGMRFNSVQRKLRRSGMAELPGPRMDHPGAMYGRPETEAFAAQLRRDAEASSLLASMKSLTGVVGVAPSRVASIVAAGLVGSETLGGREMYRIADARGLLRDLHRAATGHDAGSWYLRPRFVLVRFPRLSMGDLLRGALSGRLRVTESPATSGARKGTRPLIGVNNFLLGVDGVRELDAELSGFLTVNGAAASMGIDYRKVLGLVEIGYLDRVGTVAGEAPGAIAISKASIDGFKDRFTTHANLNKLFPELRLDRALVAIGAKPVARRSAKSAVYERTVIEQLREFETGTRAHRRRSVGPSHPREPVEPTDP